MTHHSYFYSCDWGTTRFRLRLVSWPGREVLAAVVEDSGVRAVLASLGPHAGPAERAIAYAAFLRERVQELARAQGLESGAFPVVVSGMASSSVGWRELPYARTPVPVDGRGAVVERVPWGSESEAGGAGCWLVSGVRSETDMMRGEETELIGLYASGAEASLARSACVLLPGTHSKHLTVRDGAVCGIRTFLTGELFEVLARHSLLRASVVWPLEGGLGDAPSREAFEAGLDTVQGEGLTESLFRVRTRTVLGGVNPAANGWFLSGLLIGAEISGLAHGEHEGPVVLAGAAGLQSAYALALRRHGLADRVRVLPVELTEHATVHAHAVILQRLAAEGRRE
ncbi:MAG: 2-dehydro-3-deoxygalactonokinase [Verrucomicrobiales bacterium]|nr:2-dehydro-3-deoxygalactonokinase [Verrucomicrobiales bacterium]